jgi:hypothetical protein
VTVNPGKPARDLVDVDSPLGLMIAAVDSREDTASHYAYRAGGFVRLGSIPTG